MIFKGRFDGISIGGMQLACAIGIQGNLWRVELSLINGFAKGLLRMGNQWRVEGAGNGQGNRLKA